MSQAERPARNAPAETSSVNWLLVILLILMVGLVFRGMFWNGGFRLQTSPLHNPDAVEKPIVPRGDLAEDEKSTIALFQHASPSVVHITTLAVKRDMLSLDVFGIPQGAGSGFVWDKQGYIVTNYHVIQSAQAAQVTLADHSEWDARLVGVAADKDLAVLKIDAPEDRLHPIESGTSENLLVGQKVFAIGNPFGLDQTLTTGVISGLGREILSVTKLPIQGVIQTDAAINPGNSGGPLLDSAGLLIGVNTAIYSPSGASAGIGFAVPVDTVRWIVPQLIRDGEVKRVGIGIALWDDQVTARLGLEGVLVRTVNEGGPAGEAGLLPTRRTASGDVQLGDLIVAVNGRPVRSSLDLYRILDQFRAGDSVEVTVQRDGREQTYRMTLQVLESQQQATNR